MKNPDGKQIWYFDVIIKKHTGEIKKRQGVIASDYVTDAMDELDKMAERWKCKIQTCKIHEVDKHGELVLQTIDHTFFDKKDKEEKKELVKHQPAMYPMQYASVMPQVQNFPTLKLEDTK